jgi:hypothetical protein
MDRSLIENVARAPAAQYEYVRPTVVAGLTERDDHDALCLALEIYCIAADVVKFYDGSAVVQHLRHCSRSSRTPNRRWPDAIVLDASLPELDSTSWQLEFAAIRRCVYTPVLLLGSRRTRPVWRSWPSPPDEIIVRLSDAQAFIRGLGDAVWYWLRRSEILRLEQIIDAPPDVRQPN